MKSLEGTHSGGNHWSDNSVDALGKCKTDLIDRIGLDSGINEFGNKLALEVLPSSSIDTYRIFVGMLG